MQVLIVAKLKCSSDTGEGDVSSIQDRNRTGTVQMQGKVMCSHSRQEQIVYWLN